jgi:hypothetical protein
VFGGGKRLMADKPNNHGYPPWKCEHGHKPEYCAECLTAGVAPPLVYKGTGNESVHPASPYIYITPPEKKPDPEEELLRQLDAETRQQELVESPSPTKDRVEVLIPHPRLAIVEAKAIPDLCPHGGVVFNGITYCGKCQKNNTGEVAAHIMYTDLLRICEQEGRRHFYYRVSNEDQVQHAFEVVWSKLAKIVAANNPPALARTIARQAVSDLRKKADNWKLVPVSDGTEPDGDQSGGAVTPSANYDGDDEGDNSWLEVASFENDYLDNKGQMRGPGQIGTVDWDIPGGERFWVPPVFLKMEIALMKAMAALPRPPQHKVPMAVDMMIKRWVGYFPEIGEQSYETIGEECNPVTNARRVKYLIQKGIRQARAHILLITSDAARKEKGL